MKTFKHHIWHSHQHQLSRYLNEIQKKEMLFRKDASERLSPVAGWLPVRLQSHESTELQQNIIDTEVLVNVSWWLALKNVPLVNLLRNCKLGLPRTWASLSFVLMFCCSNAEKEVHSVKYWMDKHWIWIRIGISVYWTRKLLYSKSERMYWQA